MINYKLNPPPEIVEITRVLEDAGFEAWCVGGAVRDALLGIDNQDWDLATSAVPEEVRKLFKRTVPVGIEFGTIGVLDDKRVMHEVTTFRKDVETDGRHAVVKFGVSLEDDLARRDFTINAIAYSPIRNEIRDPFEGARDLSDKVLRAVGVPRARMEEDRLRSLRGIRFASRFNLKIEPKTWDAIESSAPHLGRLSAERVKQEIEKTVEQVQCPGRAFKMWRDSGAFSTLIPRLANATNVQLNALDFLPLPNSYRHPQRKLLRIAALMAVAKHGTVLAILKDLRFSNSDSAWISDIVNSWHNLGPAMKAALSQSQPPTDAQLRRWAGEAGRTRIASVFRIGAAVWNAERDAIGGHDPHFSIPSTSAIASAYRRAIRIAYRDPVSIADLAVNGTDLQGEGIQGKRLGIVLRALLDLVIDDPALNTRDQLLDRAIRL